MGQPSLFSAEMLPPQLSDLGGLLAAHGQVTSGTGGARLSILVADRWRARAIGAECRARDVAADAASVGDTVPAADAASFGDTVPVENAVPAGGTAFLLRTERDARLTPLATRWTRGAVKAVPADLAVDVGLLRLWLLASGRPSPTGYLLGLDPHAPGTHQQLAGRLARAGFAGALVGGASAAPVIRLTGRKRIARLLEFVGDPPAGAPGAAWPRPA